MFRSLHAFLLFIYIPLAFAQSTTIPEFTRGMTHQKGYFDFYYAQNTGKLFLRIDNIDEEFLFQSSLPQGVGSNDIGLDRGQLGATRLVQFERFGDKVLLKQLNTRYRVDSDNPAEQASIDEAFADSVIAGLRIVATQGNDLLVDYTDFLLSDIHDIAVRLEQREQGTYKVDPKRSGVYMPRSKAFPDNTELEALVTYAGTKPGKYVRQVTPDPDSISVHLHHSLVRLPGDGFEQRAFHPYSGFWKMSYLDYASAIDSPMEKQFIPRHRLAKQNPDQHRSEVVAPIIYYLDPGIPEPIKSALRDGALWWNEAFTEIGYTNAFRVEILPPDADPMDVRYNVIQWVHRATRGWSYGYSVIDPRTGEIIKGHVTLGSLRVRQDYLIALGLTSPFDHARATTEAQKAMALARIRQLSAHEVGHTLGIAHNFAASADNRASVMDYPHPLITLTNGKISLENAYDVGVGAWDKHAIAYGYQDFPEGTNEKKALHNLLAITRDKGLRYKSDPDSRSPSHATSVGHLWDNGRDPLDEFIRVSKVRSMALANFGINSLPQGHNLSSLEERLVPIYLLHRYQLEALGKLIGGVNYEYEQKGNYDVPRGVAPVDSERQRQALTLIMESLSPTYLALPESLVALIPPKAYGEDRNRESFNGRTGVTFDPLSAAEASAGKSLMILLDPYRLNRVAAQHAMDTTIPSVNEIITLLFDETIRTKQAEGKAHLQKRLKQLSVNAVMSTIGHDDLAPEVRTDIQAQLLALEKWLKRHDDDTQNRVMIRLLEGYWQTGKWHGRFEIKELPPGSPI